MIRTYVGIDPGKDGALVALDGYGRVVASLLLSRYSRGKGLSYDAHGMARGIRTVLDGYDVALVALEQAASRRKDGKGSLLVTGAGWGVCAGILGALGWPVAHVRPHAWQSHVCRGLPALPPKDRVLLAIRSRLPSLDLTPGRRTKPHQGLADAAGLAIYASHLVHHGSP